MTITITAPAQGAVNTPIGVTGTCAAAETIGLALSTQNTAPPSKLGPATVAGTQFAGTVTPPFAGTWYAWAVDPLTGAYAVSGAITVPSNELGSVSGAPSIGAGVPSSAVPLPLSEVVQLLQAQAGSGGSGAPVLLTVKTAATVSGHTAVAAEAAGAVPADAGTVAQAGAVIGIATTGAATGGDVVVQTAGPIVFSGWSWTPGKPVYVGANGALTQTAPVSGFCQIVAVAQAADTVVVTLDAPILL